MALPDAQYLSLLLESVQWCSVLLTKAEMKNEVTNLKYHLRISMEYLQHIQIGLIVSSQIYIHPENPMCLCLEIRSMLMSLIQDLEINCPGFREAQIR